MNPADPPRQVGKSGNVVIGGQHLGRGSRQAKGPRWVPYASPARPNITY